MARIGDLRERLTIQRFVDVDDGAGNVTGGWLDMFTVWAAVQFSRGGEGVLAARLTARQPAIVTVRNSSETRGILPSDRAVDARTAEIFNIREKPRVSRDNRGFLEMLVEAGVAT